MTDAKEQVRAKLALEDIVSETVALKPAGKNRLRGLCPFHSEKTPSFHVLTDRGYYHCFGCQATGDLFNFVRQTQGLDFPEALKRLAERAGVELPATNERQERKRDLLDVNAMAQSAALCVVARCRT